MFSTPDDVTFPREFIGDWFFMPRVAAAAVQFGLATQEQFDQLLIDMDNFKDAPGAVGARAFGESIWRKP